MANGEILRGEVYWVSVDDSVGAEIQTGRPALVVSGDKANEKEETVVIAYITSGGHPSPHNVTINTRDGTRRVLCRQIRTIDKRRLTRYEYTITGPELVRVTGALAGSLCIPIAQPERLAPKTEYDKEKITLQAERDAYKRLYETVLEQFVEVKFNHDLKMRTETVEPELEPFVEEQEPELEAEPDLEEEIEVEFVPEVVNVNTASAQEISDKTGLPMKDAYAITGYRKKNGLFVELEELLEVSRISKPKFERYKECFTLGEPEPEEQIEELPEEEDTEPDVEIEAEKVNVNEANIYELMRAGFGKSEAGRIVRWVKKYGEFKSLDELTKVDGVTGKLLRKIRDGLEV